MQRSNKSVTGGPDSIEYNRTVLQDPTESRRTEDGIALPQHLEGPSRSMTEVPCVQARRGDVMRMWIFRNILTCILPFLTPKESSTPIVLSPFL